MRAELTRSGAKDSGSMPRWMVRMTAGSTS